MKKSYSHFVKTRKISISGVGFSKVMVTKKDQNLAACKNVIWLDMLKGKKKPKLYIFIQNKSFQIIPIESGQLKMHV